MIPYFSPDILFIFSLRSLLHNLNVFLALFRVSSSLDINSSGRKGHAYGENIASFDLNSDRINMVILDKHGIILDTKTEWYPEVNRPGYPGKRGWTLRLQALGRLLRHAYENEVGTVLFEDLYKMKRRNGKNNKSKNRNANRKMNRFPKRRLLEHCILMAWKYGYKVYLINPGYTSKLAEKLKNALCLDINTTSAYTLALKYLNPDTFKKLLNKDFQRRLLPHNFI